MRIISAVAAFGKGPDTGSGGGPAAPGTKAPEPGNIYIDMLLQTPPSFKAAKVQAKPFVFTGNGPDAGTEQWRMADVICYVGKVGGTCTGIGIVRRVYPATHATKPKQTEFVCQWPSRNVGPVRHAIFDVSESEPARNALEAAGAKIVAFWIEWQKNRVKSGVVPTHTASATISSVMANDEMLKELGIS